MNNQYTVSKYLLDRLYELGVSHIFGVPGDYNLSFLDHVIAHDGLEWIGNCNELNAAYAADGYARINGISALITTYGVGELSAINGIAGSYAEYVPVVEITGTPSTIVMEKGLYVHHSLGDGNFQHFINMFKEVTVAQTFLTQENADQEIDHILLVCLKEKRPVHINLPIDICDKPINKPKKSLLTLLAESTKGNEKILKQFLHDAITKIDKSKKPIILTDFEVNRYEIQQTLYDLAEKTGFPVASLSMGKGVFPETHPQFIGVYSGTLSSPYVRKRVDESDCIISIGVKLIDTITGRFSQGFSDNQVIEIHPYTAKVEDKNYNSIFMKDVLNQLTLLLHHRPTEELNISPNLSNASSFTSRFISKSNEKLTQKRFWQYICGFLQEGDVILADQGTAFCGASIMPIPNKATFVGQPLWASIGYTLPSLLGTQLADRTRRNILIIGDGSFQMTAQELSTILRQNITPIIFLINNNGYTIERAIHGKYQPYNDIGIWQYHKLPSILTHERNFISFKVQSETELEEALNDAVHNSDKLRFIEVIMSYDDKPKILEKFGMLFGK
ncbi:alpha-keto acid decarboxylase family protein [Clostridium sp. HBUAS56017]|uniref:alpha-keto acid decarboxylase family protein n=1 Tax=Clostridium sp. HBUAS56017 TaxID=2571128 RepID=UPI0011784AF1|nr:alpha-keto acid decarboxylase family protein [Clostridium sp. HBUAS56017]